MPSSNEAESVGDFLNSITNVSADKNAAIDTDNTKSEGVVSNNTEPTAEGESTETTEETVSADSTVESISADNETGNGNDTQPETPEE